MVGGHVCVGFGSNKVVGVNASFKEIGSGSRSLRGRFWIGDNEYGVIKYCADNGLLRFTVKEVADFLEVDSRRAYDAVQRLVKRGWVRRIARGLYELLIDPLDVLSRYRVHRKSESMTGKVKKYLRDVKDAVKKLVGRGRGVGNGGFCQGKADGSREPRVGVGGVGVCGGCGGVVVSGWRFDNVRGFVGGCFVGGDRGRVLGWGGLGLFDSVSFLEVQRWVGGCGVVPGLLVLYTNWGQDGGGVRVEWRPPSGFVGCNGVLGSLRMFWEVVLVGLKVLVSLLPYAPLDVLRRFVVWLSRSGFGRVLLGVR